MLDFVVAVLGLLFALVWLAVRVAFWMVVIFFGVLLLIFLGT